LVGKNVGLVSSIHLVDDKQRGEHTERYEVEDSRIQLGESRILEDKLAAMEAQKERRGTHEDKDEVGVEVVHHNNTEERLDTHSSLCSRALDTRSS